MQTNKKLTAWDIDYLKTRVSQRYQSEKKLKAFSERKVKVWGTVKQKHFSDAKKKIEELIKKEYGY